MNIPRIVIAGTNSGCGKTTIAIGLMAALVKRGLKVQPFKVGPDYIDPMFHKFITGSHSRNLDSWMLEEKVVSYLFSKSASVAEISIIEGVMGIYDGYGGYSTEGSTAHVSKIIDSPVILVLNGEGMSLSAVPIVQGIRDFDRDVDIRGVIINNIKSSSHYKMLKSSIEDMTGISVIGYLPKVPECTIPGRHLGLVQEGEIDNLKEKIAILSSKIEETIDLSLLLKISQEAKHLDSVDLGKKFKKASTVPKIGVAKDKAFNFYYKDNLELLEEMGAELMYFSPLSDSQLPKDIDGLYIGGGYPEVWAKELSENTSMRQSISKAVLGKLPIYAECGGLMYLSKSITGKEGKAYDMVCVLPGRSEMTSSLKRFGYVDIEVESGNVLADKGFKIRAHEFHYSITNMDTYVKSSFSVMKHRKGKEITRWQCGYCIDNLLAGYPHLHFWSNTDFAVTFVDKCVQYKKTKSSRD